MGGVSTDPVGAGGPGPDPGGLIPITAKPPSPDPSGDDTAARVLLSGLAEPGDVRLAAAIGRHGAAGVVRRILSASPDLALATYRARLGPVPATERVAADLQRLERVGGRLLLPGSRDWPTQLDDLGLRAPLLLWVRGGGQLRLAALRSVSVVGARASTSYGNAVAGELAAGLAERGWCVVSGGAFGIDAAAHRGALAGGGTTVAALACGVDVSYPRAHEALFTRLLDDGVLVSESVPGATPYRGRFLVRNRVIAALSRGTVVVEAALRSGSLATAREARELGRVVMGVPGPVTSAMSAGVHRLLREDGLLVSSVAEVVEAVGELGLDLAPRESGQVRPYDALDPLARAVLDALPARRALEAEAIGRTAGLDPAAALAALGLLELTGFVVRDPAGWRLSRA